MADLAANSSYHGTIIEYGVLGGLEAPLPVGQLLSKGLTITGFTVSEIVNDPVIRQTAVDYVLQRVQDGQFSPLVAKSFDLADYKKAFQQLQDNNLLGRIVISNQ